MDKIKLYKEIETLSLELGFVDFGVAHVSELMQDKKFYTNAMDRGYFASMSYLHRNLDKRFNPANLVEGAQSILVFLSPYSLPDKDKNSVTGIAEYALGKDYHKVIKDKLFVIMEHIKELYPNFSGRAFTDSAPILERAWAVKAGLGFIGQNNFLISPSSGIKNLIGVIVANVPLPDKFSLYPTLQQSIEKAKNGCKTCNKCLKACKNGSLVAPYTLDARKCTSYLTIESKNIKEQMQSEGIEHFAGWYYGCDICLNVCPWNGKNKEGWMEYREYLDILKKADYSWWCNLSDKEFKDIFKDSPLLRGGKENILAAIEVNLTNIN